MTDKPLLFKPRMSQDVRVRGGVGGVEGERGGEREGQTDRGER